MSAQPLRARARLAVVAVGALLLGTLGVALAEPAGAQAETVEIAIMGYEFTPAALEIEVGTTVVWTNHDSAPHNVISTDGGPLSSPTLQTGESYSYTFTEPGTYAYYCSIHPDMTGTITVTGSSSPTDPPTTDPPTTDPPAEEPECPEGGLIAAVLDPFWVHFQGAHLQTSPLTQVQEALNTDQYILMHTILLEQMAAPVLSTVSSSLNGLDPLWTHVQAAHLQTSPLTQVQEALDTDQYLLTHTIMVENMLTPTMDPVLGSC